MRIKVRKYRAEDLPKMIAIWNDVVLQARAFPQEDLLDLETAKAFFLGQSYSGVAEDMTDGQTVGLYILHPNNIGRCGHICNASYAVDSACRGQGIGRQLVLDSLAQGRKLGFRILQFNAVAVSNAAAHKLYGDLDFRPLGRIPGGFRRKDGSYEDICLYYHEL